MHRLRPILAAPAPITPEAPVSAPADHPALVAVAQAIGQLRYGVIQLTIHDGRVVQLDVTERQRFG